MTDKQPVGIPELNLKQWQQVLADALSFRNLAKAGVGLPKRESSDEALELVARCAALTLIDLAYNLKEARKEWMEGSIAKGAYEYVQSRHDNLYAALQAAGFTEKDSLFGFLRRPTTQREGEQP